MALVNSFQNYVSFHQTLNTYITLLCRQGRLDDFQQTLFDEYMDLTPPAASHSSGINIKIHPEPKNIFGKSLLIIGEKYHEVNENKGQYRIS